jgi:DNA polymerase-4
VDAFAECIAHVDMDAFFVEVERRRRPELRGRAVVVGGAGPRSVVASASYEARSRGVHSAMPIVQARRLCPHAVVVPPDHEAYGAASAEVFAVLAEFTPRVEGVSVDEAFLGLSGLRRHYPDPAVGHRIRRDPQQLSPCSVGLAPPSSAKMARVPSRTAPAGARERTGLLHRKPVRALWGVGEATHARLEELGVSTVGDLAAQPRDILVRRLGPAWGGHLSDLAAGIDAREVTPGAEARSISVEETYDRDLTDLPRIHRELLAQADRLADRLHHEGYLATTVHLKVRYPDFTTLTRSHTFGEPVATARDLHRAALDLLTRTDAGAIPVRLLGIAAGGLVELGPAPTGLEAALGRGEKVVAEVHRFGGLRSIGPAWRARPQRAQA